MSNEASEKLETEIGLYRDNMLKKEPEEIYRESIRTIFMEGTAYYAKELAEADNGLAKLIMTDGKTLEECARHVMSKARSVCNGMGADLPTEQFHEFIWNYYKLPVNVAKTAIADAKRRQADKNAAELVKIRETQAKAKAEADTAKANAPKQLSFIDMMNAAG